MADSAVSSSARGAGFLILLQISSRALTFALNQVLLRFLSPTLLGAAVQLELYIISAHHFARESFRVACQRQSKSGIQSVVNLSYLAIAGGIPIVLVLAQWYLSTSYPDVPYFVEALRICELAAVIELVSEPAFVAVQQKMLYKTRAAAEASAVVVKTFATAGLVFWGQYRGLEVGVLPFAVGELAYCSVLTVVYLWHVMPVATADKYSLLLSRIQPRTEEERNDLLYSRLSRSLVNLSISLYVQSGIKYLLTQGDVIVSTTLASLEDQGMYALSANYGGLIARMVFRPIEDSSRNLFAQLCSAPTPNGPASRNDTQPSGNIRQAAMILCDILRVYNIVSLLIVTIGPTGAPLLLRLVAGSRWSDSGAGEVLGTYTYSIPLLALNGVSEAFVAATATEKDLYWQSVWMGVFSAVFAGSAWVFLGLLGWGAKGLVAANCVNMGARCIFNGWFVKGWFKRHGLDFKITDLLPNMYAMAVAVVVPSLLSQTTGLLNRYGLLGELVRVGAIGATFALFIAMTERKFLMDCYRRMRS